MNVITEAEMLRITTPVSPGLDIAWKIVIPIMAVSFFGIIFLSVFARRQYTNRKKTDECARKGRLISKDICFGLKCSKNEPKCAKLTLKVLGKFCSNFYAQFWKR